MPAALSVDAYIAQQPNDLQPRLTQLRQTICEAAPAAEEGISYGMPAYRLHGPLVYFALFKNHIGLYALPATIEAFQKELAGYELSRGTIRLPLTKPLPLQLIADMVKFRARENTAKAAAKSKAQKTKVKN